MEENKKNTPLDSEQNNSEQNNAEQAHEQDTCEVMLKEWQEKYIRLSADFENLKKRLIKDQVTFAQSQKASLLVDLISVIDNFDRAMTHKNDTDTGAFSEGMQMIHEGFHAFLIKAGVQEMEYGAFDPNLHEALMQIESEKHDSDTIVEVMEKGYMLGDSVLRPAKVTVAK